MPERVAGFSIEPMKTPYILVLAAGATLAAGCQQHTAQAAGTPVQPVVGAIPFATPPVLSGTPDVATLVAKVGPSVVNITTIHRVKAAELTGSEFPWSQFFGSRMVPGGRGPEEQGPREFKRQALGSGFILDSSGHVLTNAHVVDDADEVRVRLADEREFTAKVKGRDQRLDLAVLELEGAKDLPASSLGSSDKLRVGEYVVAIGNPFGLGQTVTMGIVSAKDRAIGAGPYDDFIQTDASINPGNSGGPLFDLHGQVIGINTAINPNGKGIGFAIPIDAAKDVVPQLLQKGRVERGRLGVVIQPVDATMAKAFGLDHARGALVGDVEKGGPADRAGLHAGDVIVGVSGVDIAHSQDLPRVVARHAPGTRVNVRVLRDKVERSLDVTLDTLKDEPIAGAEQESQAPEAAATTKLGVELSDAPGGGAVVRRVASNGRAAGSLRPGDVILEVNRVPVAKAEDVSKQVRASAAEGAILLRVRREDRTIFVAIDR